MKPPLNDTSAAVFCVISTLKQRRDFLDAARGARQFTKGIVVQGRARGDGDPQVRVGFTCSKKVGNAVARNRAKRRLRAVARLNLPRLARPGWDYVLIGKAQLTAQRDFSSLVGDFEYALRELHK